MCAHIFISDEKGNIRFTKEGRGYIKPIFELAGININEIHTIREYKQARKQVSPYFMQHLANRACSWPDTDQFKLLKEAIFSDEQGLEHAVERFDARKRLRLIK